MLEKWRDYASTRIAKQEEKAAAELAEKQAQEEEERLERVREETHARVTDCIVDGCGEVRGALTIVLWCRSWRLFGYKKQS